MKTASEKKWFFSQPKEAFIPNSRTVYNPDPHYDVYKLKSTGQLVSEINLDFGLGLNEPFVIGAIADLHFNVCNQTDREDEELVYTEKCRIWPENLKWAAPAIKALDACDYCDAAVIIGDMLDYLSNGALNFAKSNVFKKYPDFMVALGGHDYTKQMQTKRLDLLPLEERLDMLRAVWPNDIHYYSRTLADKMVAVIIDNSQSKYLPCQIEPLRAEIENARNEGKIILVFQHEPMSSKNPDETLVMANIVNGGALREREAGRPFHFAFKNKRMPMLPCKEETHPGE